MQHFKEGGHAKAKEMCYGGKTMKKGGDVDNDTKQDKALIKKAFKQHDEAEHDKEPTEIKLKKGGRSKKETGTVKKFKSGGSITNVYEAKKKSGDIDAIQAVKNIKPGKAAAPSGAKGPDAYKKGGNVKKYADGGGIMDTIGNGISAVGTRLKNNVMGTPEQNRIAQAQMDRIAARKAAEKAAMMQGMSAPNAGLQGALTGSQMGPMGAAPAPAPATPGGMKKGGKIKKMAMGGETEDTGAYIGSRLNMPSNTRFGKLNAPDTRMLNKADNSEYGRELGKARAEGIVPKMTREARLGITSKGSDAMPGSEYKKGGKTKKMNTGGTAC